MAKRETARTSKGGSPLWLCGLMSFLLPAALASTTHALVSGQSPAAILVFPGIAVRGGVGELADTVIELTNTAAHPATAKCHYTNGLGQCSADQLSCANDTDCVNGQTCVVTWAQTDFIVELTSRQVIGWRASQGLSSLPCDPQVPNVCNEQNRGAIPPVPQETFLGELKCVELSNEDESPPLVPVARNDFMGKATIIRPPAPGPDVSSYTAIGIEAVGPNNGDLTLCLGQDASGTCPTAEYAPCPGILTVNHFFENAVVEGSVLHSDIILAPCSENFESQQPVTAQVVVTVRNEFENLTSLSFSLTCWKNLELASFPLFSVGVQGTLTGQSRIQGLQQNGSGVEQALLGVVMEAHDLDGAARREAAYHLNGQGLSTNGDIIRLAPIP